MATLRKVVLSLAFVLIACLLWKLGARAFSDPRDYPIEVSQVVLLDPRHLSSEFHEFSDPQIKCVLGIHDRDNTLWHLLPLVESSQFMTSEKLQVVNVESIQGLGTILPKRFVGSYRTADRGVCAIASRGGCNYCDVKYSVFHFEIELLDFPLAN